MLVTGVIVVREYLHWYLLPVAIIFGTILVTSVVIHQYLLQMIIDNGIGGVIVVNYLHQVILPVTISSTIFVTGTVIIIIIIIVGISNIIVVGIGSAITISSTNAIN